MIHLVCDCGALTSSAPGPGARSVPCRACGKSLAVPAPEALGLDAGGLAPPSAAPPVPVVVSTPLPPPPETPRFDADSRLDLVALEREASRLLVMGRLAAVAGIVGAGVAAVLPGLGEETRVLCGAAALFTAAGAWTLFRGARSACLASVALAQRQRELLRRAA